jgi:lipopolysaccharide/colanic/teichoic acid biosynthesis glycosyltransferase
MIKRAFDIAAATMGLVVLSPVMAVIALAILCTMGRPVVFRQVRVGLKGQPFHLLKFRTMNESPSKGVLITTTHDPRITPLGRRLRHAKLDEIPQLVNVLRGEMSIVGPRPEVARYVDIWPDSLRNLVLSVRPGLTDPASVALRHEESVLAAADDPEKYYAEVLIPMKLSFYADYVRKRSVWLDLQIVGQTIRAIWSRRSTRPPFAA